MVNANSPDTVLEDYLNGLVSETDTTKSCVLEFESESYEKRNSKWDGFLQLFRDKFKKRHFGSLDPLSSLKISKRFSCSMREVACGSGLLQSPILEGGLSYFKPQWKNFSLSEIEIATNNFHHENLIGKGGYAEVHKGRLRDGKLIAVKRLTRGAPEERIGDFLSELGIMAHLNHPNTTKLIGYGVEGGYYLVLELSPHGSLASMLHGIRNVAALDFSLSYCLFFLSIYISTVFTVSKQKPGWYIRYKICDFGLAKWLPERWTHLTVLKFDGTFGYLAPEFLMHGIVNEKTDVFAFGVLLLELITGRRALDYSQQSLVMWAKPLLKKKRIRELADPSLGDDYNLLQMNLMVLAASLCVQHSSIKRPRISQASSATSEWQLRKPRLYQKNPKTIPH
nr:receptor-like cytosolic serine/threonine-protein kinase RBK2 isoform X1 [Ipomoea batatas]